MKISFHGADRGVTGSCHLIECGGVRVLVDCGLYQGGRELAEDNAEPFDFDAASIDVLLLTHAHLDHCGRLPLLAKRGFRGEIVTTAASRELARLVMLDAARLQEEDAERRARKQARRRGGPDGPEALYTVVDAMNVLDFFGRTAVYGRPLDIAPGIRATFFDAGHILGSASILLELEDAGTKRRVVFSGDIGNAGRPLLSPPRPPPECDVLVMETTYGDRNHRAFEPSVEEIYQAIEDTHRRGGNVIIPTFALERAQELLYFLHEAVVMNERLPRSLQVFLNSPMAISATAIFQRHPECLSADVAAMFRDHDPFAVPGLHFTRETAELDGDQPGDRRGGDHGGFGHGDGRTGTPSPQAQSVALGSGGGVRRLRRGGDAGAAHHRRGQPDPHLRRGNPGESEDPYHRRLLRARGPGRTAHVAGRLAGEAHLPRPRRRKDDADLRRPAEGHPGGDAEGGGGV